MQGILQEFPGYLDCYLRLACLECQRGNLPAAHIWASKALSASNNAPDALAVQGGQVPLPASPKMVLCPNLSRHFCPSLCQQHHRTRLLDWLLCADDKQGSQGFSASFDMQWPVSCLEIHPVQFVALPGSHCAFLQLGDLGWCLSCTCCGTAQSTPTGWVGTFGPSP